MLYLLPHGKKCEYVLIFDLLGFYRYLYMYITIPVQRLRNIQFILDYLRPNEISDYLLAWLFMSWTLVGYHGFFYHFQRLAINRITNS